MANKKIGRKSSAQDNFLEPNAVTSLTATNVGTSRPYLLTANTTSAASASGTGGAVDLAWTLPAASPPATSYTITTTPATYTVTTGTAATTYRFQGLASNTAYTFTVVATNAAGSSVSTTSSSATATTVPSAPTSVSVATGGAVTSGSDRITFSPPSATGGSAVTSYRIVSSLRGQLTAAAASPFDTADPTLPDASADESYTVYASNALGESAGATTAAIQTFTPPHFPPFFPPFFPPYFPPFFPPFFPPHFPPFFPPFFPPHFPYIIPWFGPPCVEENTLVDTPNGPIPVKDIQVGDVVLSTPIEQFDESQPDIQKYLWSSDTLTTGGLTETVITSVNVTEESDILYFNGQSDIRMTFTQPIFVKTKSEGYRVKEAYFVEVGDMLVVVGSDGQQNEVEVTSIDYVTDEIVNVYQLSAEPYDWFFVSGILLHNK